MRLVYGSVCSGIEAATAAWHPLGWTPRFFAEIEKFPSAVLAHHYGSNMPGEDLATNGVPNYGDFTKIPASAGPVDVLVGGTPCQSFSVAGKRLGLDDPRGNLALEYLALARRLGACWFLWENVPGVLSSVSDAAEGSGSGGPGLEGRKPGDEWIEESDFATFLQFAIECGYGVAYRVLDAQFVRVDGFQRAVPQRRRRMFVVGYLGDWRPAAAVLLEPEGMRGDPAPGRGQGEGCSPTIGASTRGGGGQGCEFQTGGGLIPVNRDVSDTVTAKWAKGTGGPAGDETQNLVAEPLGFNCREDPDTTGAVSGPLGAFLPQASAVAYDMRGREDGAQMEGPHDTANIRAGSGGSSRSYVVHSTETQQAGWAVRRLQGFSDGFTDVPWRGKDGAPDGPRYKALGNSMAVNVMRWIGQRIDLFEQLVSEGKIPDPVKGGQQ